MPFILHEPSTIHRGFNDGHFLWYHCGFFELFLMSSKGLVECSVLMMTSLTLRPSSEAKAAKQSYKALGTRLYNYRSP